jgi:hypothetical protein
MEGFQKTILFAAIIILIVALVFIGMALSASKNAETWPPITSACPEWWDYDGSGNCVNIKDLGTCPPRNGDKHLTMNFNTSAFTGSNGACNKYNWSKACGVSWDGVNFGIPNTPCQTTTSS